jgi:ribosomal protein L16 Arg81 hydroxylase
MSTLLHGRKRWALLPPAHAFYSTKHFAEDLGPDDNFAGLREEHKALECVVQSGDILFLPPLWGHGVLYERTSIGVSFLYQSYGATQS